MKKYILDVVAWVIVGFAAFSVLAGLATFLDWEDLLALAFCVALAWAIWHLMARNADG